MVVVRWGRWLEGLMAEETCFFGACGAHLHLRKNERNVFCLHCCLSICPHCLPSHSSHPLLQVRRYVYHDVVRLADLEKLIHCSYIQAYTINGAKVVFLKKRTQQSSSSSSRTFKPSSSSSSSSSSSANTNICFNCDRILQNPFHFCSLSCKVEWLVNQGDDLSAIINRFDASDFTISQFEGLRMDASEETNTPVTMASSASNNKKKNKPNNTSRFLPRILLGSRRKGAPHRAPLS